ncbi:acyltransferase [Neotamlana laminarinivorans]|uniref:Acyltransferase n=1 Tax=Neotamlana laminarinivorans TaxID=2883124 RepID=A0A9X1L550_9FLAO|nr:acyltransferase [Tamlana laminarinivorans]MCB4799001.1 acyltransferase [Tamlana laminarinivorans]
MASISYLWKNRAKFSPTSISFYRAWGKRLFSLRELLKRNNRARKLRRKGASISEQAEIGEVNLSGRMKFLTVGGQTFIGRARIVVNNKVSIGKNVCINDGAEILTGGHDIFDPKWSLKRAEVQIDDYAWIGTGAMILAGVHVGRGAVIGARAVVTKSVKPGEIIVGNPGKPLSKIRDIEFDYSPCEFVAVNRAWLIG